MSRVLFSIGAVQLVVMLLSLVRAKTLALALGPSGYGIVSTVDQTALSLVQLGALSMPFTALKFMSREHDRPEAFGREFATFFAAIGLCGLLTVAVMLALLSWAPQLLGSDLAVLRPYLLIALLGVPPAMMNILFVHTLAAAQRSGASAMLNMVVVLALAIASVVGVLVDGVRGVFVFTAAASVVAGVASLRYLMTRLPLTLHASPALLWQAFARNPEIVRYSFLIYSALASYSLTMLAMRYFVFAGLGATHVGVLQALIGVALTVGAILNSMTVLSFAPLVNSRIDVAAKGRAANHYANQILLLIGLGGLVVTLFPETLLTLLFSRAFAVGAVALFTFVIWQLVYQVGNVYLQLLIGVDEVAVYALATVVGYGLASALFPLFVARLGLSGVALALAVALVVSTLVAVLWLRRRFGIGVERGVLARFAFAVCAIVAARFGFQRWDELSALGLALRAAFVVGVAGVFWLTLAAEDRAALVRYLPRVMRERLPAALVGDRSRTAPPDVTPR
jgi:O-antigen/teichoic acid export membrane protein